MNSERNAKQYILLGDDYRGEEHIYSADSN